MSNFINQQQPQQQQPGFNQMNQQFQPGFIQQNPQNPNQSQPYNPNQQSFQNPNMSSQIIQPPMQGFQNQMYPGYVSNNSSQSGSYPISTHDQFYQMQQNQNSGFQNLMQQSEFVYKNRLQVQHGDFINPKDSTVQITRNKTLDEILLKETVRKDVYELIPKEFQADLIHTYLDEFSFMSKSNLAKIQKNIQSQYRKSVFQCIIGDVLWERQQKSDFDREWLKKMEAQDDPSFQSHIKFQINKQGDVKVREVKNQIGEWDDKIEAIKREEASLDLIGFCKARGNLCHNRKNVCMEICKCLAICRQCLNDNATMQNLHNCPNCGIAFGNRKSKLGLRHLQLRNIVSKSLLKIKPDDERAIDLLRYELILDFLDNLSQENANACPCMSKTSASPNPIQDSTYTSWSFELAGFLKQTMKDQIEYSFQRFEYFKKSSKNRRNKN